jgi:hypothetical protein
MRVKRHGFDGWDQRYDRIEAVMAGAGIHAAPVLSAWCFLLDAPVFWRRAQETMQASPLFFVERRA